MSVVHAGFRPLIAGVVLAAVFYGLVGALGVLLIFGSLLGLRAVWVGRRQRTPREGRAETHDLLEGGRRA